MVLNSTNGGGGVDQDFFNMATSSIKRHISDTIFLDDSDGEDTFPSLSKKKRRVPMDTKQQSHEDTEKAMEDNHSTPCERKQQKKRTRKGSSV
jgi:hypothetical protein